MPNPLRGEFSAVLAGQTHRFDTTLGTIARIEETCGGRAITAVVHAVVVGRRAADQIALLAAALRCGGAADPEAIAVRATVPEAEAFILALMGALGFALAQDREGGDAEQSPLAESIDGDGGGPSRSAA